MDGKTINQNFMVQNSRQNRIQCVRTENGNEKYHFGYF